MSSDSLLVVPIKDVKPDPAQPRRNFDPDGEHAWLVASIKQHGIISPITVRPDGNGGYIVTAGERRLRAATEAKLSEVPVVLRDRDDDNSLVIALVENVVRADLNPVEEGDAYQTLIDQGRTVEQISELVNRDKGRIADRITLARLPVAAREAVMKKEPIKAMRVLAAVATVNPALGEALAHGVTAGVYAWGDLTDPRRCLFNLLRADLSTVTEDCKKCNGIGYTRADGKPYADQEEYDLSGDDEDEAECAACNGHGHTTRKAKKSEAPPPFFAVEVGRYGQGIVPSMIEQLDKDAQERIVAAGKKAQEHYDAQKKKTSYASPPPMVMLHGEAVTLAARGTEGVSITFNERDTFVTSPEFVSEWLPEIYEGAVEEYISPPRRSTGGRQSAPSGELTPAQQKQAEKEKTQRAKEREEAAAARATARQFNADLGIALAQIGEVPVSAATMRMLVGHIIDRDRRSSYSGRIGEGHALWHRYTAVDFPTRKNGDPILPRKSDERIEYVEKIDAYFDRQLVRAKTPEQALAVLVRYLGVGLADLSGMANADLEGASPYRFDGMRAFVKKLLPVGLRKRVPDDNGIKGRSYVWSD